MFEPGKGARECKHGLKARGKPQGITGKSASGNAEIKNETVRNDCLFILEVFRHGKRSSRMQTVLLCIFEEKRRIFRCHVCRNASDSPSRQGINTIHLYRRTHYRNSSMEHRIFRHRGGVLAPLPSGTLSKRKCSAVTGKPFSCRYNGLRPFRTIGSETENGLNSFLYGFFRPRLFLCGKTPQYPGNNIVPVRADGPRRDGACRNPVSPSAVLWISIHCVRRALRRF